MFYHIGAKVVDQALHAIDNIIDETHGALEEEFIDAKGASVSTKHLKNSMKYYMAFRAVVLNLPPACALIKPYLDKL